MLHERQTGQGTVHGSSRAGLMRVDAHQHYWQIGMAGQCWPDAGLPPIFRDFIPTDLDEERARATIDRTVLVQSQPDARDTEWLLMLAETTPSVGAVIGWADFRSPTAPDDIRALARHPKLRGLRPMLQDLAPDWILHADCAAALAATTDCNLVFEALVRPAHLPALQALAGARPMLDIVIDHGAKPDIAKDARQPWAAEIARLARLPNVYCKLSGLVTEARPGFTDEDLRFYVMHLLESFGPKRLMWGSDWPVLLLATSYAEWLGTCEKLLAGLDDGSKARIFGGTAQRLYAIT